MSTLPSRPDEGLVLRRPVLLAAFEGWNDAGDAATSAVEHLEDAWDATGVAAVDPDDYYPFYTGYTHERGDGPGEGANLNLPLAHGSGIADMLAALVRWVEEGIAPTRIIATKYVNDNATNGVQRTRPLCLYPQVARYSGSGSIDEAANFACVQP